MSSPKLTPINVRFGSEADILEEPYVSRTPWVRNRFRLTLDTPRATIAACRRPRPPFFIDEELSMTAAVTGGCACGAIRYECAAEPVAMLNCHCRDCQRSSGAPFASGIVVAVSATHISGTPKTYSVPGASGGLTTRSFCADCGTPLFTRGNVVPDFMSIRFPTLDDQSGFQPMVDIWTSSAQPWVCLDQQIPRYSQSP